MEWVPGLLFAIPDLAPTRGAAALLLGVGMSVDDALGAVGGLPIGGEDLVGDVDLGGVNPPLAVTAQQGRVPAGFPKAFLVLDVGVGPVDTEQAGTLGRRIDLRKRVVLVVARIRGELSDVQSGGPSQQVIRGPKMTELSRSDAWAISRTLCTLWPSSIWGSKPIEPTSNPAFASACSRRFSTGWISLAAFTFGMTMSSMCSPAAPTTSKTSSYHHRVSIPLMR